VKSDVKDLSSAHIAPSLYLTTNCISCIGSQ